MTKTEKTAEVAEAAPAMMSIYEMYETDAARETEGFWYVLPANPAISFLLARAGGANVRFAMAIEAKSRGHRGRGGKLEGEKVDVELVVEIMKEAFAETIILDWKGITNRDGKKVAYSPAAAVKLFIDLGDLFGELRDVAGASANYRTASVEDDVGN